MSERRPASDLAPLLARCAELLGRRLGLHFPPERRRDLERTLMTAAAEAGRGDSRAYLEGLLAHPLEPAELARLAGHLAVGETYFFRDPEAFAAVARHFLPQLLRRPREADAPNADGRSGDKPRLRLWSAGCSTGEEPYSLAMMLQRSQPTLSRWDVSILATDVSLLSLARAEAAIYDEWSFRGQGAEIKAQYFHRGPDGRYRLGAATKALVRFARLNLVEDPFPAPEEMDVIFCRNVLMYFAPEQARAAVDKLSRCLAPGGWLVVSPVETALVTVPELELLRLPELIIFHKVAPRAATEDPLSSVAQPLLPLREPSLEAAGEDGSALILQARILANQGRLEEARAWCERAMAADKLDSGAPYLLALILMEQGLLPEAVAALQRSLYLRPNHVLAHFTLGRLLVRMDQRPAGVLHFRRALVALEGLPPEAQLPDGEGIAAGSLRETVTALLEEAVV